MWASSNKPSLSSFFFKKIAEKLERVGVLDYNVRKGKPSQIRLYNLRKWFRKQAYQAGSDFVNYWMGHTNLDLEHYFSRDVNIHRKVYEEKALPNLLLETETLSETAKIISKQAEEIQHLEVRLDNQQKTIDELEQKNAELKQKLNGFTITPNQMEELMKRIEKLEKK